MLVCAFLSECQSNCVDCMIDTAPNCMGEPNYGPVCLACEEGYLLVTKGTDTDCKGTNNAEDEKLERSHIFHHNLIRQSRLLLNQAESQAFGLYKLITN